MNPSLFTQTDDYITGLFADDETLHYTIDYINKSGIPQESISPVQGRLLQVLMAACNAGRILEIGTSGGYSTLWMAKALPANGKIITIEVNENHASVARHNFENAGMSDRIQIIIGKAVEILPQLIKEKVTPFDFIFIDADKPPYKEYFEYALKLSRKGTIIVCDNVIRAGKVLDPGSNDEKVQGVQRFNKMLSENKNVVATILQMVGVKEHDGMAIAVVK